MGTFSVDIEIGDVQGIRFETLEALVDTGESFSWVPRDLLERLGVQAQNRWDFKTPDGRIIQRDVAETIVRCDGETRTTIVVFGDEGSSPLLGAYPLEGSRLAADALNGRLVPVRGLAMRL